MSRVEGSETVHNEKKKFFKGLLVTEPDRKQLNDIKEKLQDDRKKLPVYANRKAIVRKLSTVDTLILLAGTGSGKTTQIPQVFFYRHDYVAMLLAICQF